MVGDGVLGHPLNKARNTQFSLLPRSCPFFCQEYNCRIFFFGEDNGVLWCSWRMRRREDMVEVRGEKGKSGEGWGRGLGAGEAQEQFLNLL